jgi:hypothetical protein
MVLYLKVKPIPMLVLVILPIIFIAMICYESRVSYDDEHYTYTSAYRGLYLPHLPLVKPLTVKYNIQITNTTTVSSQRAQNGTINIFQPNINTPPIQYLGVSPLPISSFIHNNTNVVATNVGADFETTITRGYSISGLVLFSVPFIAHAFYPLRY